MKKIKTKGMTALRLINGTDKWYFGYDYPLGDLCEAENEYYKTKKIESNRIIFINAKNGEVKEPIIGKQNQYFGDNPIYLDNMIYFIQVDFNEKIILIYEFNYENDEIKVKKSIELDKKNGNGYLYLYKTPLMLVNNTFKGTIKVIYPDEFEFKIGEEETFYERIDEKMYFLQEVENEENGLIYGYGEEIIIREYKTGKILKRQKGSIFPTINGEHWILE